MSSLERTAIEILVVLVFIGSFALWERHKGAVSCEDHDKTAVASQEAHNATILVNQNQAIAQEKQTYEDALLQPVTAPVVRLCYPASSLPQAPTPASGTHGSAPVRATNAPDLVPGPDIGKPSVQVGHDADLQVSGLKDYILEVCLK